MEQETPSARCDGVRGETSFNCKAEILSHPSAYPNSPSPDPERNCTKKDSTHGNRTHSQPPNSNDSQRAVPTPFLSKTYELVDDPASDEVVSWNENGCTFVVWRLAEFAKDILPNFFKHNNFSSFVRQLNTYGFRKVVPDRWEFAHDCFRKGEKYLLIDIHRQKAVAMAEKPITIPHKLFTSSTNSASEQAVSSSSSPLSSATDKFLPLYTDEAEKLKKENMLLASELSCLRSQCSDLLLYIQRHVKGPSEFTSPVISLLQSKSLSEGMTPHKSFWGFDKERSPECDIPYEGKDAGADCELFSSKSGDDGGENLDLRLVLPQASCNERYGYDGSGSMKSIGDGGRSPPRLFGIPLPCQKRISLGSSRYSEYQEKV